MAIKCPKCHSDNPDTSSYCADCSTQLDSIKDVSVTKTLQTPLASPGKTIAGKYKILSELGRGGMGVVYKAEDTRLERTVAIKFLSPELTKDSGARERFIQEAKAASAIEHNNICNIHEIDETEDGRMFIAMAYYPGESLKERIKRSPMERGEVIDIALQIAEGLSKAHQNGIVHRDIKPGNIMVTSDGVVKILDFGLAKLAGQVKLTRTGFTVGTVAYMSPEQAKGEEVNQRTDIWSLGVVLYEMISGRLPFRGEHDQAVLYSILNREPAPVKSLPYEVPEDLERIMRKALAKDPEKRYVSGGELAEALQRLKSELISDSPYRTRQIIFRKSRRHLLIGATSIIVLTVILFTWILTRPSLAFSERDKLLVADVDNQTGEEIFDLALRTAIEADLQQSPYASIFDKGQVAETLRLMRKDPSSLIDEELGCDICRFSGVRALILPRIFSAGDAYELQAILVDPIKKRQVDRIRVTVLGREQVLLSAIDGLASKVRSRLGESIDSIEKADVPVVKATTSSWEALDYLARGKAKQFETNFKDAAKFFELALEKDPKCATAKVALGHLLIRFLGQKEKGKELISQAFQNAADLPQRELLKIKAFKRELVDEDLEGALDEYRMMIELYPDLNSAYNNSGVILRSLGRYDEAVAMFEKSAEIAAIKHFTLGNLWWTHLNFRKDPCAAEEVAERLISLAHDIAIHFQYLGYSLAAQARFEEALQAFRQAVSLDPQNRWALPNLAHVLLASGNAVAAVPIYREVRELVSRGRIHGTYDWSSVSLAIALIEAGDSEAAKEAAAEGKKDKLEKLKGAVPDTRGLILLGQLEAVIGQNGEAKQYLDRALKRGIKEPDIILCLAQLYALMGQDELAIETIKRALDSGYSDYYFPLITPAFQSIRNDPRFRALFGLNEQ